MTDDGPVPPAASLPSGVGLARAIVAVAARPALWPTAIVQLRRLAAPHWWRHPPFLPVPDAAYLRFRLETAYGDGPALADPADVVTYLRWCRAWRSTSGARR